VLEDQLLGTFPVSRVKSRNDVNHVAEMGWSPFSFQIQWGYYRLLGFFHSSFLYCPTDFRFGYLGDWVCYGYFLDVMVDEGILG